MIVGQTGFLCHLEDYDRGMVCQVYGSLQFLKTKQNKDSTFDEVLWLRREKSGILSIGLSVRVDDSHCAIALLGMSLALTSQECKIFHSSLF